ncbi:hypothetical protein G9A89_016799 [Geosiphon pyriformis]|nr:hypothetical protein G9A89_016799 [Geosiphon pyriformis]
MKKTIKASGSKGGFKTVASRKKRKEGVLEKSIDNKGVAAKALGARLWDSETGNTMESESIDMEEKCLVEETSVDYDDNSTFMGGNPDQTPKGLRVKTKKVLRKPLGVIDYNTVDTEDDVLDDSLLLPPPLLVKPSVQVSVRKFFALDIDLVVVAGKSSQKKVNFGASTPSKFGGIIRASFTSEKAMMAAAQLTNDHSVVVNTDLKCPINNHTNWAIVLKKIPVETSIEAVHAAISEFEFIKSIKMQLVGLWQKAIVELEDQIQADLLAAEWSILIGKDVMHMAWADIDKQMTSLVQLVGKHVLLNAVLKTWASMVGKPLLIVSFGGSAQSGSISYGKPLPTVNSELEDCLKNIENSLVSLAGQIGELAKRLDSFVPAVSQPSSGCQLLMTPSSQNQGEDIVIGVGSDDATNNKTAAVLGSTVSPEVVKLENMLEGFSASVISLSMHLDSLALAGGALPLPFSQ